ncbi:hypothetical protein [Sporichthya sp.]|uniref:hypothetical protein n=1 Tax=Sporichthya sp. TaxID=65475 RepID=UPI0017B65ECE|nr:hypothetical protein [Sporichthya sp.]MBA3744322.1 hypothetical protein [Sporichthya sp.]
MGTIQKIIDGYTAFATEDGTIHDNGTIVLIGGAVLILALSLYIAYNVTAALFSGIRKTVVGTVHGVVNVSRVVGRKPEVAVATASIPVQRMVPISEVGTGRPIARRREVAKVG